MYIQESHRGLRSPLTVRQLRLICHCALRRKGKEVVTSKRKKTIHTKMGGADVW